MWIQILFEIWYFRTVLGLHFDEMCEVQIQVLLDEDV